MGRGNSLHRSKLNITLKKWKVKNWQRAKRKEDVREKGQMPQDKNWAA